MEENTAGGTNLTRLPQRAGRNTRNSQRCLLEVICMHAHLHFHIVLTRDDALCLHHSACYFKDLKMISKNHFMIDRLLFSRDVKTIEI